MASEDFVINIGLNLNDKQAREQLDSFYKKQINPIQKRLEKAQRGLHVNLSHDIAQTARSYMNMFGGATTPAQAIRYTAGGTPRAGSVQRNIVEAAEHELRMQLKQEKQLQTHLGKMGSKGASPVEKVWQYLDEKKRTEAERRMEGYRAQRNAIVAERDREEAKQKHQEKILEIIAKNTGVFKKWSQVDKAIVQREQRSILSSLKPGQELTDYQQQVLGVGFGSINLKSLATKAIAGLGAAIIPVYKELTREAGMLPKISSMTGYSAQAERTLQYAGIQNAYQSMASLSSFNDRLRLGQVSAEQMQGFAMFGRRTYAQLRENPNDIRAIHAAFAADIADAESRGFTRQTAAQAMGMSDYLPTLSFTPEEMEDFYQKAESAKYQQYRAKSAYMTEMAKEEAKDSVLDLFSKNKAGAVTGVGAGAITGAALGSIIPGIGTAIGGLIGMGVGALGGGLIGAGVQELASPDSAGLHVNNTVNVAIDRDAMNEILNSGSSTQTFATTATAEPW